MSQPSRSRIALTLALGQAVGRGSLALTMLLLVRQLPASEYGQLALTVALVAIVVAIADGGFARLLVRDLARSTGTAGGSDVWRILGIRSISVLAVTALVAVAGMATGWTGLSYVGLSCAFLVGEALSFGFESAAVGLERPWRFVLAQAVGATALLAGVLTLVVLDAASLHAVIVVLAGASLLRTLAHAAIWQVHRDALPGWRNGRPAAELWRAALPFLALTIMTTMQYRLGVVVCYALEGSAETAPYAAAVRVLDVAGVLGAIAFSAVAPVFSRAHQAGSVEVWRLWRRFVTRMSGAAIPVSIALAFAGEPIAGLLFGERYAESAGTDLSLLSAAAGIFVLLSVSSVVLYMDDRSSGLMRLTAFNLGTSLVLTISFTALYGHHGTAAAVSIGELLSLCGFALVIAYRYRFGATRPLRRA